MGNAAVGGTVTGARTWMGGRGTSMLPASIRDMHETFEDAASTAGAAWSSGYGTGYQQYTGYIHIHW